MPAALEPRPPQPALGQRLRAATRALHTEVERSGVMRRLLRSGLDRPTYCLLLRNLHAVYAALETGLQAPAAVQLDHLKSLVTPELLRAGALQRDLQALHGSHWPSSLPLAPAAVAYAARLQLLALQQPQLLAAHAYVRYLGDLYGGQVLASRVATMLKLAQPQAKASADVGLAFYHFDSAATVVTLQARFRQALDLQAADEAQADALVQEACSGFVRHRELFAQLDAMSGVQPTVPDPLAAGTGP